MLYSTDKILWELFAKDLHRFSHTQVVCRPHWSLIGKQEAEGEDDQGRDGTEPDVPDLGCRIESTRELQR